MPVFRALLFLMLLAAVGCFGAFAVTGNARWKLLGLALVKWTVLVALGFFAVLIAQRLFDF